MKNSDIFLLKKLGSLETPGVTGKFGLGVQNEAGQRLIEFCQENALVTASTLFKQHKRRLCTGHCFNLVSGNIMRTLFLGFPGRSDSKESTYSAGDPGLITGSARSPGGGNGNPLGYSCLENSMERGAWWVTVHGVAKSQT